MRKILFLLFLASPVLASPPIVTPSTATVYVGSNTVQFASTDTVTWSLAAGSTGTITAGGLYTSPRSFAAKNLALGCPLLPNDHIYNTRIDTLPVDSNSNNRITSMLGGTTTYIRFEVDFPTNVLSSNTTTQNMVFHFTPLNDGAFPIVPAPYTGVESSLYPNSPVDRDRHILGISSTTCRAYEIYNSYPPGTVPECPTCNSGSGTQNEAMSYELPANGVGVDAAGLFVQPLLLRYSEMKTGVINHALRFTMDNGDIYSGPIWPAQSFTNECSTFTICMPYGARFRLKASFDDSAFSPAARAVTQALKKYGMFMADGGTAFHVQSVKDLYQDSTTYAAIHDELGSTTTLTQFQFEQVDESSLMVSTSTGKVAVPNAYVVPDNYAIVIASNTANHTSSKVYVALQPVTVGTYNIPFQANSGALSVMAGTPQFQIPYWVKGATTTTVTCSMSPSIGTLTSGCLYTAPATQINVSSTVIVTITPTADSTGAINIPLTIFPSDAIRINVGGKSAFNTAPPIPYIGQNYGPDANGSMWYSDPPGNIPAWGIQDGGFPQSSWPSTTTVADVGLYYTFRSGINDGAYSAMVPNGTYSLTIGFGLDTNNGIPSQYVMSIDSQGQTLLSSTTLNGIIPGNADYTPGVVSYPINVSNNQFYFAIRDVQASGFTQINNWSLTPTKLKNFWVGDGGYKQTRQEQLPYGTCSTCTVTRNWDGHTAMQFGAKKETVPLVLYMGAGATDVSSVSVTMSNLTGADGTVIPFVNNVSSGSVWDTTTRPIQEFYVRYLQIVGMTFPFYATSYDECWTTPRLRRPFTVSAGVCNAVGGTGWLDRPYHDQFFPDILVPYEMVRASSFTVAASSSQAVWFDIYIASTNPAQVYTGTITVREGVNVSTTIPVSLLVYNFSLPDTPSMNVVVYDSAFDINYRHQGNNSPGVGGVYQTTRDHYAQMFHAHGLNVIGDSNFGVTDAPTQEIINQFNGSIFTSTAGYGNARGYGVGNPDYSIGTYGSWTAVWSQTSSANFCGHVKGWQDWFAANYPSVRSWVYLQDEPTDLTNVNKWSTWMTTSTLCQTLGYRANSFVTADTPKVLTNAPNLNMPTSVSIYNYSSATWQTDTLLYETAGSTLAARYNAPVPGGPAVYAQEEVGIAGEEIFWALKKKGIQLQYFWEGTNYNNSGENVPLFTQARTFGTNTSSNSINGQTGFVYSNGDGVLVYPGTDVIVPAVSYGLDGAIASWRLKGIRRGIQDVDYITQAMAIDSTTTTALLNTMVPQVLWEYQCNDLITPDCTYGFVGPRGGLSWSDDPNVWELARESLAQIIVGAEPPPPPTPTNSKVLSGRTRLSGSGVLR